MILLGDILPAVPLSKHQYWQMAVSDLFSCRLKSSLQLPVAMLKRGWKAPSNTYRALSETARHSNRFTTCIVAYFMCMYIILEESTSHSFTLASVSVHYTQYYSPIIISIKRSMTHSLTLGLTSVSVHCTQYHSPIIMIISLKQSMTHSLTLSLTSVSVHHRLTLTSVLHLSNLNSSSYHSLLSLFFWRGVGVG